MAEKREAIGDCEIGDCIARIEMKDWLRLKDPQRYRPPNSDAESAPWIFDLDWFTAAKGAVAVWMRVA